MAKISEIIESIQKIAPLNTQEEWDNSGWQIRLEKKNIRKVMLCVTVTDEVLRQIEENNCDMVISHHPLLFNEKDVETPLITDIIRKHIPVYSVHTPLDKAKGGTTDSLVKLCGLNIDETLNGYTKISYADITLKELINRLKNGLNIDKLRVTNFEPEKSLKKIAFCAGIGTGFCEEVEKADCNCFVTADLKYHTAVDFKMTIIDVGHLEGEKPALQLIKNTLTNVDCVIAKETPAIKIV